MRTRYKIRKDIGRWRFVFQAFRWTTVDGINSKLADGNHILMLDLDGVGLEEIRDAYSWWVLDRGLSRGYVVRSSPSHYQMYFLTRLDWRQAMEWAWSAPLVDYQFLRFSAQRGHFTLRITEKGGSPTPQGVTTIESDSREDVAISELESFTRYETILQPHNLKG